MPHNKSKKLMRGFTLLEILIALFIFTLISAIVVSALHSVMTTQSSTEKNTRAFNQLQMTVILLSRDIEQAINRPIISANEAREPAFTGSRRDIRFTRAGLPNPTGELARSTLQRVHYFSRDRTLIRETWPELDITQDTRSIQRELLPEIEGFEFEYLDARGKFHSSWPAPGQAQSPLPNAVRVYIVLKKLGKMSQLYVIPH